MHLAQSGDASLWPLHKRAGAHSKYTLGKPSPHSCHCLASMPSVSSLTGSPLTLILPSVPSLYSFLRPSKTRIDSTTDRALHPKSSRTGGVIFFNSSGTFSSILNLLRHTTAGFSFAVAAVYFAASSPVSLHTLHTTQRSESSYF